MTSPLPVQPAIVVIPNGAGANVVRLSLKVTPFRPETAAGIPAASPVALGAWPDAVAALAAGRFRIDLAAIQDVATLGSARTTVGLYAPTAPAGTAAGAMALWRLTFPGSDLDTLWEQLDSQEGPTPTNGKSSALALAPRLDSHTLCQALIATRSRSLKARVDASSGARALVKALSLGNAPKSLDAPITEQEAWALPVRAKGPLAKMRQRDLAARRATRFDAAVGPHLAKPAVRPAWHGVRSHAALDAIHTANLLRGSVDPVLDAAVRATRPTEPVELLASRMESLALVLNAGPAPGPQQDDDGPDAKRDVRRKLAAILNYPTIAKYLGMSFDVEVPRHEWDEAVARLGGGAAAVSASFGTATADAATAWTAFVDAAATPSGSPPYLGPADPAELGLAPQADRKFVRGMLDLGARSKHDAGEPRYSLQIVDPVGSTLRHATFSATRLEALLAGTPADDEQPELGGRGIALLDRDCNEDAGTAKRREIELGSSGATKLLFAGDLVNGYRPSVGIALRTSEALAIDANRWRSLVAREVTYGRQVDVGFVRRAMDAEQEHGHVRMLIAEQKGQPLLFQELFVWTGDSLGVPNTDGAPRQSMVADDAVDLPVDITYGLPTAAPGIGLPPLREGRRYAVGIAACFVNGCGPTIAHAAQAHAHPKDTGHVLGSRDGTAFRFGRCERIPPPVVLLRDGTPIVTAHNLDRLKGETLTTLVIRREDGRRAQRYLLPERIDFNRAEQQGMFGTGDGDEPKGALNRIGLVRTAGGAFPRAVGGRVDATDPAQGDDSAKNSRGPVAAFKDPSDVDAPPYYPDSYSRGVWARFNPVVPASGAKLSQMTDAVAYRRADEPAVASRPVLLELKPGDPADPRRAWVDRSDHVGPDRPGGVALGKIAIALAPATTIDLALDSDFDPAAALACHVLAGPLLADWGLSRPADLPAAAARLGNALATGRIEDLQGTSVLRLVHAVKTPLLPPRPIQIVPVLATVAPDGHSTPATPSWSEIVSAGIAAGKPFAEWSQPGGATCFFVGQIGLDAPSTGGLGLDARWKDLGPEMVVRDARAQSWIEQPAPQSGRLFSLTKVESDITRPNQMSEDEISLLKDANKPRGLSFSFRDGRARRLETRLIAVSRFAEYYPEANPTGSQPGKPGPCEIASAAWEELWIPCTFRPGALDIKRVTPWFTHHQTGGQGSQDFSFSRDVSYRVEVGREGYTSGEGEQLALVFPAGDPEVCDYATDTLKPFASGLTRWGRDPLHEAPVPQRNITPARFAGALSRVDGLQLLPGADPVDGSKSAAKPISVTALSFPLNLDPRTGTYYSDIAIAPTTTVDDAYMPFVQLGLARYQPHSVAGLELSPPAGTAIQLFPLRKGTVRFRRRSEGRRFTLRLSGQVDPRSAAFHSLLDVTALIRVDNGHERPRWIAQAHDGKIAKLEDLQPNTDGWTVEFEMPLSRFSGDNRLGLLIEEHEAYFDEQGKRRKRVVYGQIVDFGMDVDASASRRMPTGSPVESQHAA